MPLQINGVGSGTPVVTTAQRPSWQVVWEDGFQPHIPTQGLRELLLAIGEDTPKLLQGATTQPPPLMCVQDWPVEGADPIGYTGLHMFGGLGVANVGQIEEWFARLCYEADQKLGEPAACRWFLNWWDDTPRDAARKEMAVMIGNEIARRLTCKPAFVEPIVVTPSAVPSAAAMTPTEQQKILFIMDESDSLSKRTGEQIASNIRQAILNSVDAPEGTPSELYRSAMMLDSYAPDLFPADDIGRIHAARGMMESTADVIKAFLKQWLGEDEYNVLVKSEAIDNQNIATSTPPTEGMTNE